MNIERFKMALGHEAAAWARIQEIRATDTSVQYGEVAYAADRHDVFCRGVSLIQAFFVELDIAGFASQNFEPGHGMGHIRRDYINALRLLRQMEADPRDIFIGFIAGVLHDVGCFAMDRFQEPKKAVRHAEAGALLFLEVWADSLRGMANESEALLIAKAIMGHTHYLAGADVVCQSDGVTRRIEPYQDTGFDGKPLDFMWFPRWVDRLDCSGPTMVGRHFLTLGVEHEDFDGKHFYSVNFADHIRPLLRATDEIKAAGGARTMCEHLHMFASSQTNASPYGRLDRGRMLELRDPLRTDLLEIVEQMQCETSMTKDEQEQVLGEWQHFLGEVIEPSSMGKVTAKHLCAQMRNTNIVSAETRRVWRIGFSATMRKYRRLAKQMHKDIVGMPEEWKNLPGITEDIGENLIPAW